RVCRIHGQRVKADHQAGQVFEEAGTAVEQSSVGDEHDRTKPQKPAGRGDQLLHVGAQGGLAPREYNGVGLAANDAQKAQRFAGAQLFAKDVRLLLSAVTAGQIALMRGIKNDSVGCDDVGPQDLATIEVDEIE